VQWQPRVLLCDESAWAAKAVDREFGEENMKLALFLSLALVGTAYAHPGGLNAEECHTNHKTGDYHCHGGGAHAGSSKQRAVSGAPSQSQVGGRTCFVGPRGGTYTITKSGRKNYKGC
jgi:hypothetical protein